MPSFDGATRYSWLELVEHIVPAVAHSLGKLHIYGARRPPTGTREFVLCADFGDSGGGGGGTVSSRLPFRVEMRMARCIGV